MDVQYFFVTDKIQKGEMKVSFCLLHKMLGDFLTKPLNNASQAPPNVQEKP